MKTDLHVREIAEPVVEWNPTAPVGDRTPTMPAASMSPYPVERTVPLVGTLALGALRISMGFIFLWSFLDKALALGFSTGRSPETGAIDFFGPDAWINGGSPTDGAILFGAKGPFADLYANLAGLAWVEWVYMLSMLLIGTALILGVATRIAAIGGIAWMAIFYTLTAIWPEHNPFVDDHVIQALVLVVIAAFGAGRYLGLGERWERTALVKRYPVLK
jgi:thiosulfate dehydrogenase [quinone] large subunit